MIPATAIPCPKTLTHGHIVQTSVPAVRNSVSQNFGTRKSDCRDTELRTAGTLVCTRCPCVKFLGHGIAVAGIMPASCRRWNDYQGAPIIIIQSLTVLPNGKIIKMSRFSKCGTGIPMYHRGKDLGVPQFSDRDPRTAERKDYQVTDGH